jgi:hypothetical protein
VYNSVSATYTSVSTPAVSFTASNCVVVSQTSIACSTAPGFGSDLAWRVVVGGQPSASSSFRSRYGGAPLSDSTPCTGGSGESLHVFAPGLVPRYDPPTVASVAGAGSIPTRGGTTVTVSGVNLGPASPLNVVTGYYGALASFGLPDTGYATTCTVTVGHSTMTCTTSPGVGVGLRWFVTVGGQTSTLAAGYVPGVK